MSHRLRFAPCWVLLMAGVAGTLGCNVSEGGSPETKASSTLERMDHALAAAAQFLIDQQSPDGAWRSDTYGAFKEGDALTPHVLRALLAMPSAPALAKACRKGSGYLARKVQADGSIDGGPHGLAYPIYTAALTVQVLSHPCNHAHRRERDAWLAYLRQRQLTEELGWQPSDREYGGWGFSTSLPRKPRSGALTPPLIESNLSATVFALEALRAAGSSPDDAAFQKALVFVRRCQNFTEDPQQSDPRFDDGGFFFIYDDPVRNKAGVAGEDGTGRKRFNSYGSTTADGLFALLMCGLPFHDRRVAAAGGWLTAHVTVETHPGGHSPERQTNRDAVYYYYVASLARLLPRLNVNENHWGRVSWAEPLAKALLQRQHKDGAWANLAVAVREDDPVVATSFAALALAACRNDLPRASVSGKSSP